MESSAVPPDRDLYAILNVSKEASGEEIRRAYRQWAQVYHPDKYQDLQLKDAATENFQRIRDAYEILSDEHKREIYDIYGMEGLKSGYELGQKLNKPEEIKEELERLRRRKEQEVFAHSRPNGSIVANFSLPRYLDGDGIMRGMAMFSEVQSKLSKGNSISIEGNLSVVDNFGRGAASASLRHQISSVASIEFMATVGLRALLGVQTSRQLSQHSMATSGIAISLRDGSINLSNAWTRQLSETSVGSIQLDLGVESSIAVGWQKKDEKTSASGELKLGIASIGASAHYTHHFSIKSHGRVAGRIGSTSLEFEIGGGRRISKFSTVRMLYTIGVQGISWRFELHRGGQKLIIPVLLFNKFNALVATSAFVVPSSIYFLLKKYVFKPYYRTRERQKLLEKATESSVQKKLFFAWLKITELRNIAAAKMILIQRRKHKLKVIKVLNPHVNLLNIWELMATRHLEAVASLARAMEAICIPIPLAGGAQANLVMVHKYICTSMDIMFAIEAAIKIFYSKAERMSSLLCKLMKVALQEIEGLDELWRTNNLITYIEMHDFSLRANLIQAREKETASPTICEINRGLYRAIYLS